MMKTRYDNLMKEYMEIVEHENQSCVSVENLQITCKLATEMHFIKDILKEESNELAKDVYCHNNCENELDQQMHRILTHGKTEHMRKLNKVISKHYTILMQSNPKLYEHLLEEMKMI